MSCEFYNVDCMEYMKMVPDKHFNLAIVDPPYGIGDRLCDGGGKLKNARFCVQYRNGDRWDVKPEIEYFNGLFRISKNQIICGGNYFGLPPTRGIIAWDKKQMMQTLSRWEYLWTSFDCPAKMYEMRTVESSQNRIHPTQKPVVLYRWLLQNYAKPGQLIFDSHVGSGSSLIACIEMGFDCVGCEIDKEYYDAASARIDEYKSQQRMFI